MSSCCATLYVLYLWVYCSHPPSLVGKFLSRQPKLALNSEKHFHELSDREECQDFQLLLTRTKATGLPVTLHRTASRIEDRLDSHIRRFLRMLVLLAVLLVDREGWFHILVESLSQIRRAICLHSLFARAKSGR